MHTIHVEPTPATSEPLVSQSLFPYLDLDKVDRLALEDRLIKETQKIKSHFYRLTKSLIETLEESQVPLQEIKDFILSSLDQFTSTDTGVEVLDKADKNRIKAARNVSEVFTTLENYTSFFNYHFIEHIIDQFGTDLDQERLENYLEEFHNFCKRNIFEIPCNVFAESSRATAKVFALKCTDEVATMNDVVAIMKEIAETLGIPPEALQLCSVKKGCVELHFLISAAVADHIFPVSPSQHLTLSEIGVKVLSYNGTGFDCTQ